MERSPKGAGKGHSLVRWLAAFHMVFLRDQVRDPLPGLPPFDNSAKSYKPDGIRVLGLTNMAVCLSFLMLDLFAVRLANPKSVTTYCSGRRPSYA